MNRSVCIDIIHLAYHVKQKHNKVVLVDRKFGMTSIDVAKILKTQLSVFRNFYQIFRS